MVSSGFSPGRRSVINLERSFTLKLPWTVVQGTGRGESGVSDSTSNPCFDSTMATTSLTYELVSTMFAFYTLTFEILGWNLLEFFA